MRRVPRKRVFLASRADKKRQPLQLAQGKLSPSFLGLNPNKGAQIFFLSPLPCPAFYGYDLFIGYNPGRFFSPDQFLLL